MEEELPPRLIFIVAANRWSGVERYTLDLCRHFSSLGWPVHIFTRDARAVDSLFRMPGVRIHHAPFGGSTDYRAVFALARLMAGKRNDRRRTVVHVARYRDALCAIAARTLARRHDVRVVMTRHYVAPARRSWMYRFVYRRLDAHLFVSEIARRRFLSAWKEGEAFPFDPERLTVIHNSLNLPAPDPQPERERGPLSALYHGRLAPGKGLETLLDAFSIIVNRKIKLRLRILGTGDPDYVAALRRHAETLGIMERIDWTRHVSDPRPLIREAHFGVLPSETEEAFGLANIEYMYEGRPQIATNNGAQAEYLTDGLDAILISPSDPEALADAMERLASAPTLRARMGAAAAVTFRNLLSWPAFAGRLTCIYRD